MNWVLWVLLFVPLGIPVGSLMVDRILGIPARRQWVLLGLPALGVFLVALGYALYTNDPIARLVGWGALAGVMGTAMLDAIRLLGVRFGAFPADMPQIFGTIALGLAPRFQRNMMAQMLASIASMPEKQRQGAVEARVKALASMRPQRRKVAMAFMMAGLARLPDGQRQTMLQTQMGVLAALPEVDRRNVMRTMDTLMGGNPNGQLPYGQPRGMPQIPMATFRRFAERALPGTWQEAKVPRWTVLTVGYFWHFVTGAISLGIPFTLLFGQGAGGPGGTWGEAIGWGLFIWLAMMLVMPPMMPVIRFPRWFPAVPFLTHLAFAVPFALVSLYLIGDSAHAHSLVGALR